MKKIGILTFHRSINYGAFVQSLALSDRIQKALPDTKVEVIDYTSLVMEKIYKPKLTLRGVLNKGLYFKLLKRQKAFKSSLKYLPLSDKTIISDESGEVFRYITENYDAVIVGSDAVFNWTKRGFPNPYILNIESDIPRLSYAASAYGMEKESITKEQLDIFGKSLGGFKFIGVRDDYTKDLTLSANPNINPVYTCDPTVLLDMDYVQQLLGKTKEQVIADIKKKFGISSGKPVIGLMLGNQAIGAKIREKYSKDYEIVCLYQYLRDTKFLYSLTPLEWALCFSMFSVTVTSYFHGTLLSLKNLTPTVSVDITSFSVNNTGKIEDLLTRMDLCDNYFHLSNEKQNNFDGILTRVDQMLANKSAEAERIKLGLEKIEPSFDAFLDVLKQQIQE